VAIVQKRLKTTGVKKQLIEVQEVKVCCSEYKTEKVQCVSLINGSKMRCKQVQAARINWFKPGVGNLFTMAGRMNYIISLASCKINWFYP